MEVQFTPELQAKLAEKAAVEGRNPADLVQEVVAATSMKRHDSGP